MAGHPLFTDIAADIWILGEHSLIRRLVENFLDYAQKFSDTGGPVTSCSLRKATGSGW